MYTGYFTLMILVDACIGHPVTFVMVAITLVNFENQSWVLRWVLFRKLKKSDLIFEKQMPCSRLSMG